MHINIIYTYTHLCHLYYMLLFFFTTVSLRGPYIYIYIIHMSYIYSHYTFQITIRVRASVYSCDAYLCELNAVVMNVINNYYECKEVIAKSVKERGSNKKIYMRNIVKSHVSWVKLKFSISLHLQTYTHTRSRSHTHTNCLKNETDENHSFLGRTSWLHSGHGRKTL